MPKNSYEFSYMSPREKRKVLAFKGALIILMATSFFIILSGASLSLSADLFQLSGILSIFFGYINVLHVKSELIELFEPPYFYVGYEFAIAGFAINLAAWFV